MGPWFISWALYLPINKSSSNIRNIQVDSKLLSVFPFTVHENPDNNSESPCIFSCMLKCWVCHFNYSRNSHIFEWRVLGRMFEPKTGEVTGGWRKLHNEELHNLYSSPSIIRVIKSKRIRWAGNCCTWGTAWWDVTDHCLRNTAVPGELQEVTKESPPYGFTGQCVRAPRCTSHTTDECTSRQIKYRTLHWVQSLSHSVD
jgi:hypothetical protein